MVVDVQMPMIAVGDRSGHLKMEEYTNNADQSSDVDTSSFGT